MNHASLWEIGRDDPLPLFDLSVMEKLLLEKYIKIIMTIIDNCFITTVFRNLREAYFSEMGLTQILAYYPQLDVGLHVDFSSTNFSLGLHLQV